MKTSNTWLMLAALTALSGLTADLSLAAAPRAAAAPSPPAPVVAPAAPAAPVVDDNDNDNDSDVDAGHSDTVVAIGHDAELAAGAAVDAVVAIFGNATSAGTSASNE